MAPPLVAAGFILVFSRTISTNRLAKCLAHLRTRSLWSGAGYGHPTVASCTTVRQLHQTARLGLSAKSTFGGMKKLVAGQVMTYRTSQLISRRLIAPRLTPRDLPRSTVQMPSSCRLMVAVGYLLRRGFPMDPCQLITNRRSHRLATSVTASSNHRHD